jgi:hypothetical protein
MNQRVFAAILLPLFTILALGSATTPPETDVGTLKQLEARVAYNCDGSAACTFVPKTVTLESGEKISTIAALRLGMHASTTSNKTIFCNGDNIICFSKSWSIDLGVGLGRVGGPGLSASFDILDGCEYIPTIKQLSSPIQ